MSKWSNDSVMDAALDVIAGANQMIVCSAQPANRTEAVSTYALADVSMSSGDFAKANGDTSGRKLTVAQKSGIPVDNTGTATHIALVDGTNLIYVTTCTSQPLTAGNTITVNSWKAEIADPS